MRTIVTSPEFFSKAAFRAKVKTPFELLVSARRALNLPADTTMMTSTVISRLGQPMFGWSAPDGWPETGGAWINSATLYSRIKYAGNVGDSFLGSSPSTRWSNWSALATAPATDQIDAVCRSILGGAHDVPTRDAMLAIHIDSVPGRVSAGELRLRELLVIALSSPEFQRR